jgi:hypothetical protein
VAGCMAMEKSVIVPEISKENCIKIKNNIFAYI